MKNAFKYALALSVMASCTGGAYAQDYDEQRYQDCMTLAQSENPDEGLKVALIWRGKGDLIPARHCEATALITLGEYEEAGVRLDAMVEDMRLGVGMPRIGGVQQAADNVMVSQILRLAAESWLLAGNTYRAFYSASQGISQFNNTDPRQGEFHLLVGQTYEIDADIEGALRSYKRALTSLADDYRPYLAIARNNRMKDDITEAEKFIQNALKIDPDNAEVQLEYGNISYLSGDNERARKAWLWVALNASDSDVIEAAQAQLQSLALGENITLD